MAFLLCLLSVLCFALCAAGNGEIAERFEGLQPQQDSLPPFNKLHDSLVRQNLMDLIHKLSKYENGIFRQEFRETEKQGKNQKRGAISGLTTQRPCRVFYWKSWASC
uniref:Somatostatin/Cortistatin C-terminal domain-containing protein n=1 Tax=Fundulus heteroclitus TaxID=8078 RepID=A0A3Q2ULJ5_FUNHE